MPVGQLLVRRHSRAEVQVDKPSEFYVGVLDLFGSCYLERSQPPFWSDALVTWSSDR